jgi:16S rRNA (guanine966-N2)-methyltransferase
VRETLFNWLGQTLYGKRCLDLYAGSGALGFEAASRGADEVVLVELNRAVFKVLRDTTQKLGFANVALQGADGLEFARRTTQLFDVIFLDPPFQSDSLGLLLELLSNKLTADGVIYVESGAPFEPGAGWQVLKSGRASAVHYQLIKRDHD